MTQPAHIGDYATDGWCVAFDFRIDEPSVLLNRWQRFHWAERSRYTARWEWLVLHAIKVKPKSPLRQSWVHVERGSYGIPPDPDGLTGGLKALLDILTLPRANKKHGFGLIFDDSPKHLRLTTHSVRTRKGEGYTRVIIYRGEHDS